ncbi:hypothetical protein ACJJTC_000204 [Scirpophaga incertulas]
MRGSRRPRCTEAAQHLAAVGGAEAPGGGAAQHGAAAGAAGARAAGRRRRRRRPRAAAARRRGPPQVSRHISTWWRRSAARSSGWRGRRARCWAPPTPPPATRCGCTTPWTAAGEPSHQHLVEAQRSTEQRLARQARALLGAADAAAGHALRLHDAHGAAAGAAGARAAGRRRRRRRPRAAAARRRGPPQVSRHISTWWRRSAARSSGWRGRRARCWAPPTPPPATRCGCTTPWTAAGEPSHQHLVEAQRSTEQRLARQARALLGAADAAAGHASAAARRRGPPQVSRHISTWWRRSAARSSGWRGRRARCWAPPTPPPATRCGCTTPWTAAGEPSHSFRSRDGDLAQLLANRRGSTRHTFLLIL